MSLWQAKDAGCDQCLVASPVVHALFASSVFGHDEELGWPDAVADRQRAFLIGIRRGHSRPMMPSVNKPTQLPRARMATNGYTIVGGLLDAVPLAPFIAGVANPSRKVVCLCFCRRTFVPLAVARGHENGNPFRLHFLGGLARASCRLATWPLAHEWILFVQHGFCKASVDTTALLSTYYAPDCCRRVWRPAGQANHRPRLPHARRVLPYTAPSGRVPLRERMPRGPPLF